MLKKWLPSVFLWLLKNLSALSHHLAAFWFKHLFIFCKNPPCDGNFLCSFLSHFHGINKSSQLFVIPRLEPCSFLRQKLFVIPWHVLVHDSKSNVLLGALAPPFHSLWWVHFSQWNSLVFYVWQIQTLIMVGKCSQKFLHSFHYGWNLKPTIKMYDYGYSGGKGGGSD